MTRRRRDPKVRRWIAEYWVVPAALSALWFMVGPMLVCSAPVDASWFAVGLAPALLVAPFCYYCLRGPWLTPEERVAQLEREADEALAREIAALAKERA